MFAVVITQFFFYICSIKRAAAPVKLLSSCPHVVFLLFYLTITRFSVLVSTLDLLQRQPLILLPLNQGVVKI